MNFAQNKIMPASLEAAAKAQQKAPGCSIRILFLSIFRRMVVHQV